MRRRSFLASGVLTATSAVGAGCVEGLFWDGEDPVERWTYEFHAEQTAGPVAAGGYAYLGLDDRLVALDLESGTVEAELSAAVGALARTSEVVLVADEEASELLVVFPGEDSPGWRAPMRLVPRPTGGMQLFPPPTDEDAIYLSGPETATARTIEDGTVEWELPTSEVSRGLFDRAGGLVIGAGATDEGMDEAADGSREWVAIDAEEGDVVWRTPRAGSGRAPVLGGEELVFLGNEFDESPAVVQGLAGDDGTEQWAYEVENAVAEPLAVVGETLLVRGRGHRAETTAALRVETGEERWSRQDRFAAVHDDIVYTIRGQMVSGVYADVATPQWSAQLAFVGADGTPRADATVIGDGLVVGADGEFVSYHLDHGIERWTHSADRSVTDWGVLDDALYHVGEGMLTVLDVE